LTQFKSSLQQLQNYFQIPGMAILVKKGTKVVYEDYQGWADVEKKTKVNSNTIFPIASVSKVFATSLIFQLVEAGKLDLDQSVKYYLPDTPLIEAIQVKHLLSHTSQGTPGEGFLYSSRFGILKNIIEQTTGETYEETLQKNIIQKIGLTNTSGLTNDEAVSKLAAQLASPYQPTGEAGFYDPGLSTSSGIAATAQDLAKFDDALQKGQLIKKESLQKMTSPFVSNKGQLQPYGLGIFSQTFLGQQLVWGYGQNDCFSSLYLKVPQKDLTFILLANKNLLSDPARLIYGDVSYSLFALTFLENWVLDEQPINNFFEDKSLADLENAYQKLSNQTQKAFFLQKLRATALAMSFMGQLDEKEFIKSANLLQAHQQLNPSFQGDLSYLHNLSMLGKNAASLHPTMEVICKQLKQENPENPYPGVYLGFYYVETGQEALAASVFDELINIPQTNPNWYTLEALDFLASYYKENQPEKAKAYYQRIVDIGWNYAGMVTKAKKALGEMEIK